MMSVRHHLISLFIAVVAGVALAFTALPAMVRAATSPFMLVYVDEGERMLQPDENGSYHLLAGKRYIVSFNVVHPEEIAAATVAMNGQTYLLSDTSGASLGDSGELMTPVTRRTYGFIATLIAPSPGDYPASLRVAYADGTSDAFAERFVVEPLGRVVTSGETANMPIADASIQLFKRDGLNWVLWSPGSGDANPTRTDADGAFGWYVDDGTYDVRVSPVNFPDARTGAFLVTDQLVHPTLVVSASPPLANEYRTSLFAEQLPWIAPFLVILLFLLWRLAMRRTMPLVAYVAALGILFAAVLVFPLEMAVGGCLFLLAITLAAVSWRAHHAAP